MLPSADAWTKALLCFRTMDQGSQGSWVGNSHNAMAAHQSSGSKCSGKRKRLVQQFRHSGSAVCGGRNFADFHDVGIGPCAGKCGPPMLSMADAAEP